MVTCLAVAAAMGLLLTACDRLAIPSPQTEKVTILRTASPFGSPTSTPTRAKTPTTTAEPSPTLFAGPFRRVTSLAGILPDGYAEVLVRTPADGSVWLLTGQDAVRWNGRAWDVVMREEDALPSDVDDAGRLWVIRRDAGGIAVWEDGKWMEYGEDNGWTEADGHLAGWWAPKPWRVRTAPDGSLWVPTDRDIRRLDGGRWTIHPGAVIGFADMEFSVDAAVHPVALASDGSVWTGDCGYSGPGPIPGNGAFWFDGTVWRAVNAPVGRICISTVDADSAGNIWLGGADGIWRHDTGRGTWTEFRLPEVLLEGYNFTYPRELVIDAAGDLWVILQYCGGAGCDIFSRLFRVHDGEWTLLFEAQDWWVPLKRIVLDAGGQAWAFWNGVVYRLGEGDPAGVAESTARGAGADRDGRVWVVAGSGMDAALWVMENPSSD
jgi:hypothetical protein